MRKQDIKIGEEYAVSRDNDWEVRPAFVKRVRVTGEPTANQPRYPWEARQTLTPVVDLDKETGEATGPGSHTSREFRQTWAEYAAAQAERDEAKARQDDAARRAQVEVWTQYRVLDSLLVDAGIERKAQFAKSGGVRAAAEVGFETHGRCVVTALDAIHGQFSVNPAKALLLARHLQER